MEKFTIPVVQPLAKGTVVRVPTESWTELCTAINAIVESLNAQADAIRNLESKSSKLQSLAENNELNISKLAKITEAIYETLE